MKFLHRIIVFTIAFFPFLANAHGEEASETVNVPLTAETVRSLSWTVIGILTAIIAVFVLLALLNKKKDEMVKMRLFLGIIIPIIAGTLFLAGLTIYFNLVSESRGPVHWHADFRIFKCGEEMELKEPEGLSNRIGTPEFHEHGDGRIHLEGVVTRRENFSLDNFFHVLGGEVHETYMNVPGHHGMIELTTGDQCDGQSAEYQVFAYQTDVETDTISQRKLDDPKNYIISPHPTVPPGDCIIFELAEPKEHTEHICDFMQIEINKGNYQLVE